MMRQGWFLTPLVLALSLAACGSEDLGRNGSDKAGEGFNDPYNQAYTDVGERVAGNEDVGDAVASTVVPQSPDEAHFLAVPPCSGGKECYGSPRFLASILQTYPDLKDIPFSPSADIVEDRTLFKDRREAFYAGLFFAKQIMLANGQTLFDFLTKCSRSIDPSTSANKVRGAIMNVDFSMQYSPVLREVASGNSMGLQILLERTGDKITATSPLFSSAVLKSPTFMADNGVRCWR
jgi:hypothetical protein